MKYAAPITQRDLARELGLSQAAVSQALSGRGKLSKKIRDRVRSHAAKRGYRVDAALAALAAYRAGKRVPGYQGTVAWITNFATRDGWKIDTFVDYHEGARRFLEAHGYQLETFWMKEPGTRPAQMEKILRARGIENLLLCPQQSAHTETDWEFRDFSVVAFGYTLARPRFHNVTAQGFTSMRLLCDALRHRGYSAIGFCSSGQLEQRAMGSWLGGFLVSQLLSGGGRPIPFHLTTGGEDDPRLLKWVARYKPDAIITSDPSALASLRRAGLRIPRDIGFCLTVADIQRGIAGMVFDNLRIGEIAARKLLGLHHARERGVPESVELTAIEGSFFAGSTVRKGGKPSLRKKGR